MGIIYECTLRALSTIDETRAIASAGFGLGAVTFGYAHDRDGKAKIQYETFVTSLGGNRRADGTFAVANITHSIPNTAIEILESEFPVRVDAFELVPDTGGAGRHRGGLGFEKRYVMDADATFTARFSPQAKTETGLAAGWGVLGGGNPPPGRTWLRRTGAPEEPLAEMSTVNVEVGDTIVLRRPGSGGYGHPKERDPAQVREDVLAGYVSVEGARRDYGVALDPHTLELDPTATAALRAERGR
jgi:N-methylhydantoinase B